MTRNLLPVVFMVATAEAMASQHQDPGPLRLWGELSTTYRLREAGSSESRSTNWRNTGTISASSYLWKPWFALVNGSLSLSVDENDTEGQPETGDEFTDGNLRFDLFPSSRFPFAAYYNQSRNEFDSSDFTRSVDIGDRDRIAVA